MTPPTKGESLEYGWLNVEATGPGVSTDAAAVDAAVAFFSRAPADAGESLQDRIVRVAADEADLSRFFAITLSPTRHDVLRRFYRDELTALETSPEAAAATQNDRVDYLLLKNYLVRAARRLDLDATRLREVAPLAPFAPPLVRLCESRQRGLTAGLAPPAIAQVLHDAAGEARAVAVAVRDRELRTSRMAASRAEHAVIDLAAHLDAFYALFRDHDPAFGWWVADPFGELKRAMDDLVSTIQTELIGPDDDGDGGEVIVGDAIGEAGLRAELKAEVIAYEPEELLAIARDHYAWCEAEMERAASELDFGTDWRAALEHVSGICEPPGGQPALIGRLVNEGTAYVKEHDLITVPAVAEQSWRMFMMPPERQRINPFFQGGPDMIVSYPTKAMAHEDKLSSMLGNATHLSHATAFHEMIPGHHLQGHMSARSRPYRRLFTTPFYVEGWAVYWETILWDRGDFFASPESRIGSLFWRMHRCARILFSLRFHLGQLSAAGCVDLLVRLVGHSRQTARGEVRRSLAGDYSPLYQAGYLLGALQLRSLRAEALSATGGYTEKEFHDRIMRANVMPIELLRALLLNKELGRDHKAQWRFQGDVEVSNPQ